MKTYSFTDKNSSVAVILSAENNKEAIRLLEEKIKSPEMYRMEIVDENE